MQELQDQARKCREDKQDRPSEADAAAIRSKEQ
jgi:hypothetical protein